MTLVNKNKAVVRCLLAKSAIMLSENKKRKLKMWSKKWYKISCDAHLLNELLETDITLTAVQSDLHHVVCTILGASKDNYEGNRVYQSGK